MISYKSNSLLLSSSISVSCGFVADDGPAADSSLQPEVFIFKNIFSVICLELILFTLSLPFDLYDALLF